MFLLLNFSICPLTLFKKNYFVLYFGWLTILCFFQRHCNLYVCRRLNIYLIAAHLCSGGDLELCEITVSVKVGLWHRENCILSWLLYMERSGKLILLFDSIYRVNGSLGCIWLNSRSKELISCTIRSHITRTLSVYWKYPNTLYLLIN